ncbi:endonuclease-8 [Arthrobacter stackebrandtii]|uniref:DNA-(apurinic or apyrimidinic site) lyase n=1 Tax=Arthrobacter stackebrandtii TaxID=272161 RepID=A0ABS4YTN2_9MICC|nr:DNA-formamidopyrimidine glycosylase family protein [Arthrobacter stackebrandtii]MBP2412163.1 endonuclease-8 [Arthrobacter stackebrandtii]PYH01957.1 DNA glycosylase [Arthrobacter stackebrandtii]
MPEGDTVWRQARDLRAVLEGKKLVSSDFRVPAHATLDLSGQTVTSVESRGKHLLMYVGGLVIHSHLAMEGHWDSYPVHNGRSAKWRKPTFAARAVLTTDQAQVVGFSLGTLEVLPEALVGNAVGHLGPDLLGPGWDAEEALRRLLAEPERAIGLALLDQRNLAGIGNIYRNELCFLGRIHPASAVMGVPDLPRMAGLAKRLLEANHDRSQRSTTGGQARGEAASWVYGLAGKPCKRCGVLITHGTLADPAFTVRAARDIYWCPRCQAEPGAS